MKSKQPTISEYTLKRLAFVIRKTVLDDLADDAAGLDLEVVANEVANGLSFWIRANILGIHKTTVVKLNVPDGFWQAVRCALGLSYRKRRLRISAYAIFPDLPADREGCKVHLEASDAPQDAY